MMNLQELDLNNITQEQLLSLRAQYSVGVEHLKYFEDTNKFFKYPERRLKTFDTKHYEKVVPQIKKILDKLGKSTEWRNPHFDAKKNKIV